MPHDAPSAPDKEKSAQDNPPAPVPEGVVPPQTVQYVGILGPPSHSHSHSQSNVEDEKSAQLFTVPDEPTFRPAPVYARATSPVIPIPIPVAGPPELSLPVAAPAAVVRARSMHGTGPVHPAVHPAPVQPLSSALNNLAFGPPSRSASPAPSLEQAILVERKRRAASSSGNQTAMKGGWFKSSPLNGGERSGVIVAERVKRDLHDAYASTAGADSGDVCIPDKE